MTVITTMEGGMFEEVMIKVIKVFNILKNNKQ